MDQYFNEEDCEIYSSEGKLYSQRFVHKGLSEINAKVRLRKRLYLKTLF